MILIAAAIGGYLLIGSSVDKDGDVKSITKKYVENKKIEVAQDTSTQVIKQVGDQAIDNNCKDPNSSFCSTTTFAVSVIWIAFTLLIAACIIAGIVAAVKVVGSVLNSF